MLLEVYASNYQSAFLTDAEMVHVGSYANS